MDEYYQDKHFTILNGDALETLRQMPPESVHCCVTSPPYWGLRDYGVEGQMGLEPTIQEWVANMVAVFEEVRRVLRSDGTCWLNIGDSYASSPSGSFGDGKAPADGGACRSNKPKMDYGNTIKPKDLCLQPERLAIALQDAGWYVRSRICWAKKSPMPESVKDRPTNAWEHVWLLSKSAKYYYDAEAVREPQIHAHLVNENYGELSENNKFSSAEGNRSAKFGTKWSPTKRQYNPNGRNLRNVWLLATEPFPQAHFATFPSKLVEPCVKAGCPESGTVLDPFLGAGTTLLVASRLGRKGVGIELNPEYCQMARDRIVGDAPLLHSQGL